MSAIILAIRTMVPYDCKPFFKMIKMCPDDFEETLLPFLKCEKRFLLIRMGS